MWAAYQAGQSLAEADLCARLLVAEGGGDPAGGLRSCPPLRQQVGVECLRCCRGCDRPAQSSIAGLRRGQDAKVRDLVRPPPPAGRGDDPAAVVDDEHLRGDLGTPSGTSTSRSNSASPAEAAVATAASPSRTMPTHPGGANLDPGDAATTTPGSTGKDTAAPANPDQRSRIRPSNGAPLTSPILTPPTAAPTTCPGVRARPAHSAASRVPRSAA